MDEIDYTFSSCGGNEVFKMQRDTEEMVIKSSGEVKDGLPLFNVVYFDRRGIEKRRVSVDAKEACHEIVDSFVNGYTIKSNLLLRKGIYTALGATKGKSDDIENAGEESSEKVQYLLQPSDAGEDISNSKF
jgi:hypothetical protein